MPLATVRLTLGRETLGADEVYWSWAVDGAEYNDIDGVALVNATLSGLEAGVGAAGSGLLTDMDADVIELFPVEPTGSPAPAYYVQGLAPGVPVGTNVLGNQLIQCVVNELVDSPRGTAVRGRLNIGPLGQINDRLFAQSTVDFCAGIMQQVAAAHIAAGYTPVVISRVENKVQRPAPVGIPVIGYRADRRFDILKTRRVPADGSTDYPLQPV